MKDLFDGVYRYTTYRLEDLILPKAHGDLIAVAIDGERRVVTFVADFAGGQDGKPTWRKLQELELPVGAPVSGASGGQGVQGFAPGVDPGTNTFTCPRCRAARDCQALNPVCLACGYQDPRSFELPDAAGHYEVGPWHP